MRFCSIRGSSQYYWQIKKKFSQLPCPSARRRDSLVANDSPPRNKQKFFIAHCPQTRDRESKRRIVEYSVLFRCPLLKRPPPPWTARCPSSLTDRAKLAETRFFVLLDVREVAFVVGNFHFLDLGVGALTGRKSMRTLAYTFEEDEINYRWTPSSRSVVGFLLVF